MFTIIPATFHTKHPATMYPHTTSIDFLLVFKSHKSFFCTYVQKAHFIKKTGGYKDFYVCLPRFQ